MGTKRKESAEKAEAILSYVKSYDGKEPLTMNGVYKHMKGVLNGKGLSYGFVRTVMQSHEAQRPKPIKRARRTHRAQIKKDTMPFDVPSSIMGLCTRAVSLLRDHGFDSITMKADGKFEYKTVEVRGGQVQELS